MKEKPRGTCAICGEYKELTFEHFPPKSSFNTNPITLWDFDSLSNTNSYVYGKGRKSLGGFGQYTLCENCNNNTGGWYGPAYKEWAEIGMYILHHEKFSPELTFIVKIKPKNILKQIICGFMSASRGGGLMDDGLPSYLLDKNNNNLEPQYKVYAYFTHSYVKRFQGFSAVADIVTGKFYTWSEISFIPYGYLLTVNSEPSNEHMMDISFFNNYSYNETVDIEIKMPLLETNSAVIGMYNEPNKFGPHLFNK